MSDLLPDVEWENFIASIDLGRLEQERFGKPRSTERPGSPADKRMRAEHQIRVEQFRLQRMRPTVNRQDLVAAIREAQSWDWVSGKVLHFTDSHFRAAMAAQAKGEAA